MAGFGLKRLASALSLLLICATALAAPPLRLLTEDNPPFNQSGIGGRVEGLSSVIVREMFRRSSLSYSIELEPWLRAYNSALLENNTCVYSTIRTEARERQFKWVGPLVETPWALFARAGSKSIASLESVRASVIGGYSGDAVAQYLVSNGFNVELSASDQLNMRKLAAGRIDYWATGKIRGQYLLAHEKLFHLKPVLVFNTSFMYLACNRGLPDLVIRQLNDSLHSMQRDGFLSQAQKHLSVD